MASTEKNTALIKVAKTLENTPWCEDYEKMISGMLYNCMAPELLEGRFRARRLINKYNKHFPDDATLESIEADRFKMLEGIMGKVGPGAYIEPPFIADYGCNTLLGDRFYANFGLVTIGNRVMIGPNVSIFAATHETEVQTRRDLIEYAKEVNIGDDCWIGGHSCIMPGVTIGRGTTIAAGSVVTKSIPEFSVAMGTPARVVKKVKPVDPLPGDDV